MLENEKISNEIEELKAIKKDLTEQIIELDDRILYQDFGIYQPQYDFAILDNYKDKLQNIRDKQKRLIDDNLAVYYGKDWIFEGSKKLGHKMSLNASKQMIRNFNIECDLCINKVKFSNYDKSKERIFKAFETQNKFNEMFNISITDNYYRLKIEELNLAFEYQKKKQEEKEELRRKKEELREAEKVAKEIEEKRKELEKEQQHYQNYLKKINEQIEVEKSEERKDYLILKRDELNNNVNDVELALKDLDYREANYKAGYVYIISNIGAFGENIYKIGMTRRLEPEERIAELSGASVPFKFDIHAMIFSDDAPKLEATLHNYFADRKVNLVNGRKEFFNVTLDEIKKVVKENHDKSVDFIDIPDAEQYRESLMRRKINRNERD